MQHSLQQHVAVVTGASSGIGAATARALAQAGASVALLARRAEKINVLADEIKRTGGHALPLEANVTDLAAIEPLARQVLDQLGRVDILINNAGTAMAAPFVQQKPSEWQEMVQTNLLGVFYTTHVFLPQILESKGIIINVSSVAGRTASANMSVYAATKFGIVGWSEALRQELIDQGVRVANVEPGFVRTEILGKTTYAEAKQSLQANLQSMQPLDAEDIAQAILYIVSVPQNVCINELQIRPSAEKW